MGNTMTPTERAALKLKVQRALDAAGVNRDNFGLTTCTVHLDDGYYVALCSMAMEAEVIQNDPFARDYTDATTFTFAELFPELEWADNNYNGNFEAHTPDESYTFELRNQEGIYWLDISQGWSEMSFNFRTPERAKRAAQSIADLLAEAGREEA